MANVILWLLIVEVLGFIAIPITYVIFKNLPDRGIVFSKIVSLLLICYFYWILNTLGLFPNSVYSVIGLVLLISLVSGLVLKFNVKGISNLLIHQRKHLLTAEAVFLIVFFIWIGLVSQVPAINHTEKPMDFGFINAIIKSPNFPPNDMWLAGHSISYYYFGHLIIAILTMLSGIPSNFTYNLAVALIPALVALAAYGLMYNLVRSTGATIRTAITYALFAPLFIGFIGTLVGGLEFINALRLGSSNLWEWIAIDGLSSPLGGDATFFPGDHMWWWRSTRVINTFENGQGIDYTITEFPFFSFLLGDLHAHVLALPFVIFSIAIMFNMFISSDKVGFKYLIIDPIGSLMISLSLGALAFINMWDFPTFSTLLLGIIFIKGLLDNDRRFSQGVWATVVFGMPLIIFGIILFLPYHANLTTQVSGLSLLTTANTRPFAFILIWGLFLLITSALIIRISCVALWQKQVNRKIMGLVLGVTLTPFVLWIVLSWLVPLIQSSVDGTMASFSFSGGFPISLSRISIILPLAFLIALSMYIVISIPKEVPKAMIFILSMICLGLYLLMGVEFFYVQDLFPLRMNTVFKLYYQAWVLLAFGSAFGVYYWFSLPSSNRRQFIVGNSMLVGLVSFLLMVCLYYPVGASLDRVYSLDKPSTLDGLAFTRDNVIGEYESIVKIRDEFPHGRLLEAVGDDYTAYGRIASSTGLASPLNWPGHQIQWRGSDFDFVHREVDIGTIYQSEDPTLVEKLLDKYQIKYVYLGPREREKYGRIGFEGFTEFMRIVFENGNVTVYETTLGAS
ncbi:hypothetical protein FIM04_00145 [SAR202 cluster bacterium AC-409-J13_OGT_754m]|nr:hypothetical protein [SAR202 cluster bacterium AC-409-J13_OGT_754m]